MSVYSVKGKGWRYDFTLNGKRYTEAWFTTKREARQAEAKKREEVLHPPPEPTMRPTQEETTPTDMAFLELVNKRSDYVKAYNSGSYYQTYQVAARRWVRQWAGLTCGQISRDMVERFILERSRVSAFTANKEIRYLKSLLQNS
jgi:hypothetical protein